MENEVYTISILDDKDFDALPYKGISDSLGFADPETGNAFVRKSGSKEMDALTLQHEIQHLLGQNKAHKDAYGIYHKKVFKEIIAPYILPALGGILGGPLLGGLLGSTLGIGTTAAGALGGAIGGAGTSAITQASTTGKVNALPTILSGVGGAFSGGAMAPGMAASKTGTIVGKLGSGLFGTAPSGTAAGTSGILGSGGKILGIGGGNLSPLGSAANPIQAPPINVSSGAGQGFRNVTTTLANPQPGVSMTQSSLGSGTLGNLNNLSNIFSNPQVTQAPSPTPVISESTSGIGKAAEVTTKKNPFEEILGMAKKPETILGSASLLGSMAPKSPEPVMPQELADIRSKILSSEGVTPFGKEIQTELSRIISSAPQQLYPAGQNAYLQSDLQALEDRKKKELEALDKQYNLYGIFGTGEHQTARNDLVQYYDEMKQRVTDQSSQRMFEFAQNQKTQAISQALNLNQQDMAILSGINGWSADMAAQYFKAKVEDIEEIRKALGTFGAEALLKGTEINMGGQATINP